MPTGLAATFTFAEAMKFHLFVQEGCRPCLYVESQLERVEGWEEAVIITPAKEDGKLTEFAKECGLQSTPTLVAIQDGKVVSSISNSRQMTKGFWEKVKEISNNHK